MVSITILFCFIWDETFYHFDDTMVKKEVVDSEMKK